VIELRKKVQASQKNVAVVLLVMTDTSLQSSHLLCVKTTKLTKGPTYMILSK